MYSADDSGTPPRAKPRSPTERVRIVPAPTHDVVQPEIHRESDWLEVTFSAPHIPEEHFRHAIGRRYLLIWADSGAHDSHHLVMLPAKLQPDGHEVRFRNGVVDARLRIK